MGSKSKHEDLVWSCTMWLVCLEFLPWVLLLSQMANVDEHLFLLKNSVGHELPVQRIPGSVMAVDLQAAREEKSYFLLLEL